MRVIRWITKATNTYSDYETLTAFSTATMVARTRLNVTSILPVLLTNSKFYTIHDPCIKQIYTIMAQTNAHVDSFIHTLNS